MTIASFRQGRIVATPGAGTALVEAADSQASFRRRPVTGSWGDIDEHVSQF
jgi:hypothetical protein